MDSAIDAESTGDGDSSSSDEETCFNISTQNRFERQSGRGSEWQQVRKRKKVSSGSMDAGSFSGLSADDKLLCLFGNLNRNYEALNEMKRDQNIFYKITQDLQLGVTNLSERAERAERVIDKQSRCIRMLAYHSIDMEARSRRNNIIIWGITENTRMNIESLVLGFFEDELGIDSHMICIDRVHRLGSLNRARGRQDPRRPIIVRFRDYRDTETVMKNAYRLKGTSFGLDRDYPREIATARRELYQSSEARVARQNHQKIQISYPAKLYVDGKLIRDKFPEWQKVLSESRLNAFDFEGVSGFSARADTREEAVKPADGNNAIGGREKRDRTLYSKETVVDCADESSSSDDSVFTREQIREKHSSTRRGDSRHAHSTSTRETSHDRSRDKASDQLGQQHMEVENFSPDKLQPKKSIDKVGRKGKSSQTHNMNSNSSKSSTQNGTKQRDKRSHMRSHEVPHPVIQSINRSGDNPDSSVASNIDSSSTRL